MIGWEIVERLDKLEKEVRVTQDSVLLIHKDLQQMSGAMTKMAHSMETLAEVQTSLKIIEERCETRHKQLKEDDKNLATRVYALEQEKPKIEKGLTAYKILIWIGSIFGGLLLSSMFGVFIWALSQGAN